MSTIEQLKIQFEKTKENDEMIQKEPHIYTFKNEPEKEKIRKEYLSLLPKNKRLAIKLHEKLCHLSHADMCSWYYEIHDLEHDWTRYAHKEFLDKANKALEICNDEKLIMNLIEAVK